MPDRVLLKPPFGQGEPQEFDATPDVLVPLMVSGWSQCEAPGRPICIDDEIPGVAASLGITADSLRTDLAAVDFTPQKEQTEEVNENVR